MCVSVKSPGRWQDSQVDGAILLSWVISFVCPCQCLQCFVLSVFCCEWLSLFFVKWPSGGESFDCVWLLGGGIVERLVVEAKTH